MNRKQTFLRIGALVVMAGALFFIVACKHPVAPSPSTIIIELSTDGTSVKGLFDDVVPATGIPWTSTHADINPMEKIFLMARPENSALNGKTISARIIEPATDQPLTVDTMGNGKFSVAF